MTILCEKLTRKAGWLLPVALLVLAGCTSANAPSSVGARDTGTYPNLNIKPKVANSQLSNEQVSADMAALNAANAENSAQSAPVPNAVPELREIAGTHVKAATDQISGGNPGPAAENPEILKKIANEHTKDAIDQIEGR